MSRIHWQNFVTIDPEIHHGEPCIKGTRVPVAMLVGSIADCMTIEEVVNEYPQITREAVQAALAYAADVIRQEILMPLADNHRRHHARHPRAEGVTMGKRGNSTHESLP